MIDKPKVGTFAMDAIDAIAERFDGEVDTGELMLLAEIRHTDADGHACSHVLSYCTDDRVMVQIGMLRCATLAAEEAP